MTGAGETAMRSEALDTYLARRSAQGFRIETRTALQAVIVRRHRLHLLLRWVAPASAVQRLVISVDQDGDVTSLAAEPIRW